MLLEPTGVLVTLSAVPEENVGDVIGDLNCVAAGRRAWSRRAP